VGCTIECALVHGWHNPVLNKERLTRPPLYSTHTAFFLLSAVTVPAMVALIVDGGRCRRPGPSLRALEADVGSKELGSVSPGSTTDESMVQWIDLKCGSCCRMNHHAI
jgi:hypothetical protein